MSKIKQQLIPAEILDFYRDLVRVHNRFLEDKQLVDCEVKLSEEQRKAVLVQKAPLLNFAEISIEREKAAEILREVSATISRHKPQKEPLMSEIEQELLKGDFGLLLEKFIWQDDKFVTEYLEERKLEESLSNFVLYNVSKPFVTKLARNLEKQLDPSLWQDNYCYVCGWKPVYAVIKGEEKERMLRCSLCDTEWPFTALKCPHCDNENHEKLKYFNVEQDEAYRVNVCDECKGYIKTVDEGKLLSKEETLLTDIQTLHLDMLAKREGYSKHAVAEKKDTELQ